jgi:predicted RecA/RadA family phage recombinase
MKNFLESGRIATIVAAAAIVSGQFVLSGALSGVAQADAAQGANAQLLRDGVFSLPKKTGEAWAQGNPLFWDTANSYFRVSNADGCIAIGTAWADAQSADATGQVQLDGSDLPVRTVFGQHTTVTAADMIVTGLSKVLMVVASLDSDPIDDPEWASASIGDQAGSPDAGSILLKTWKNTGGTDPTPAGAMTFSKKVNWIAIGF